MRRFEKLLAAAFLLVLAGCSDSANPTATVPKDNPAGPQFGPALVSNPSCSFDTSDPSKEVEDGIRALFLKNAWPDENSALGKFNNVKSLGAAGDIAGARLATKGLVAFVTNKFNHLTPTEQATSQILYDTLITDLWCYVGISGSVFDLNPGDPDKAFDIPSVGGVFFPGPSAVPVGTLVSLTQISGLGCPLTTALDCFPGFIEISLYPASTPSGNVVVLCPPSTIDPNDPSFVVGHTDPGTGGFELLSRVAVPALLAGTCSTSAQNLGPRGWLDQVVAKAVDLLLPQPLQAAPLMFLGGIGGTPRSFSPFAVVSTTLTGTGGLGGSARSYVPPAASPSGAPSFNPPLPPAADIVEGTVGTNPITTGLPSVIIKTQGGDGIPATNNGVNGVPGVTVIFSTGPSLSYDPDSQAQVCDTNGTLVSQVSVPTDGNGVAVLPCIIFGTKAGFANLSATFVPPTFPNSNLITIVASDGTTSLTSLNWLVKSNADAAAKIATYMTTPPATLPATSPSYSFGSYPAFSLTPLSPVVLVTDQWDNPVDAGNVYWTPAGATGSAVLASPTTIANGTSSAGWTLGDGPNDLYASLTAPLPGVPLVIPTPFAQFSATGTTTLAVVNSCSTGGAKDNIKNFGFRTPGPAAAGKDIRSVGAYLSITGNSSAPSLFDMRLTGTRTYGSTTETFVSTLVVSLRGDNSSNPENKLTTFSFGGASGFPTIPKAPVNGSQPTIAWQLSLINPAQLPSNRTINMNAGTCSAGSNKCTLPPTCNSQELTSSGAFYRKGFPVVVKAVQ